MLAAGEADHLPSHDGYISRCARSSPTPRLRIAIAVRRLEDPRRMDKGTNYVLSLGLLRLFRLPLTHAIGYRRETLISWRIIAAPKRKHACVASPNYYLLRD